MRRKGRKGNRKERKERDKWKGKGKVGAKWKKEEEGIQSALVIRTTFVPLWFSEKNVLITSGTYECSYNQRNYLVQSEPRYNEPRYTKFQNSYSKITPLPKSLIKPRYTEFFKILH